jgi:archaellum component FlaC
MTKNQKIKNLQDEVTTLINIVDRLERTVRDLRVDIGYTNTERDLFTFKSPASRIERLEELNKINVTRLNKLVEIIGYEWKPETTKEACWEKINIKK